MAAPIFTFSTKPVQKCVSINAYSFVKRLDSPGKHCKGLLCLLTQRVRALIILVRRSLLPVSYTHLDVYKRQVYFYTNAAAHAADFLDPRICKASHFLLGNTANPLNLRHIILLFK